MLIMIRRPQALSYVKLAEMPGGEQCAVIIRAVITPVDATVATLQVQLIVVSVVMLLLSVLLAIGMAKRFSRPIEEITKSAETLAKGNYDTRFTGKGFYEIVALADTLNTAAVELGRVEGFRRDLLANVSHDLRTPLALIYSYAEMINDFPEETTPEQMRVIMNETKRLTTLVNDVLDLSKLQSDMGELHAAQYNLTENIRMNAERVGKLLESEGFEIDFHYDGDVFVPADETKIDRVFYNLLINAANYSGNCRKITVTQTENAAENRVRITVSDGGEGIAAEDLPYIWERYYKNGKKHKRAVTGSGLGLSIVKKIIEMHGGSYGVTSAFGKGSEFWFELKKN
jgi:signal transduction histidine kinase